MRSPTHTQPLDPSGYDRLVRKLGEASVKKHFDAYADIDWDHPDHRIEPDDPRFELDDDEPLGATEWYRALPQASRARIGLHVVASRMRTGVDFEAILSRGLLELASTRPCGSPELRYAYHEVIEESQHSLMFQELVHRTGMVTDGLSGFERFASRGVPRLGRTFPECFFVHVLAGEAPVDQLQRRLLARARPVHPLLRRIMQIHVTEEARHLCFATRFMEENVPRLGTLRSWQLRTCAPFVLAGTVAPMLRVPTDVVRAFAIPRAIVRQAHQSPLHRARVHDGLRAVHRLCERVGLVTPTTERLWNWFGLAPRRSRIA